MRAASPDAAVAARAPSALALGVPPPLPEPCTPAELRALVLGGMNESDACEAVLAQAARIEGSLDVEIGDGLLAMTLGDRLIRRGFSSVGDYARELLDIRDRAAENMAHLSRALRSRPLLRAAVRAGEVCVRGAQTVLPVAIGDAEAAWVARAKSETVRSLEKAVQAARPGADDEEEWIRFRVRLSPEDRATVDEALKIASRLVPGSKRPQQLEAMAQEYLAEHPTEAGDDGGGVQAGAFRPETHALEHRKERLELETDRWSFLAEVLGVPAPDAGGGGFDAMSADEIDARLDALAAFRRSWDAILGYCAYMVRRSGLWHIAGFASFEHYCQERLQLAQRTVEQRAALEKRLWEVPALRAARDARLAYEKLRLLARLPAREVEPWIARARKMTCVDLRAALEDRDEAQMRAARALRVRVPERVALVLQAAFRAARAVEGRLLDDGRCLVPVARHFIETWKAHVKSARTRSQKVRERDLGRCRVPGCSRRAVHAHHIVPKSRGGTDDPENLVALCACHHLRGIHGGYIRVSGIAPDRLAWEVGGRPWKDGDFGPAAAVAEATAA